MFDSLSNFHEQPVEISMQRSSFGKFYIGGWKTNDRKNQTTLTLTPLNKEELFKIKSTLHFDDDLLKYKIWKNRQEIPSSLHEGGSTIVEARSIDIEQQGKGLNILSSWEFIDQKEIHFFETYWSYTPTRNALGIVANFEEIKEFILSFNAADVTSDNGLMSVIVDGKPVKDETGKTLKFLQNSSVIGKGKSISIYIEKTNSIQKRFYGSLRIKK